jgi:hypothetical protein
LFYVWAGLNHDLPICSPPHNWDDRHLPPCPDISWGLVNFLSGLASNCNPLDLCLWSSWDYRHESPCLATFPLSVSSLAPSSGMRTPLCAVMAAEHPLHPHPTSCVQWEYHLPVSPPPCALSLCLTGGMSSRSPGCQKSSPPV